MYDVGLDIHSNCIALCVLDEKGPVVHRSQVRSIEEMTPCPKQATVGCPKQATKRLSFLRQSKEDNSMKASQHLSQAQDAASAPLTDLSIGQKTEELPLRPPSKPIETKAQLIEHLQKEFEATVDVQEVATTYEKHLAETKRTWKNGRFVSIVTEMHRQTRQNLS